MRRVHLGKGARIALAIILTCLALIQVGASPVLATPVPETYRVATTGIDTLDCGSTSLPCRTIQYAINKAESDDTILVARGTYTHSGPPPHVDCKVYTTTEPVVCVFNKHLTIEGGYTTANWSYADPENNPTIIDGQNVNRGVSVIGWSSTQATASLTMEGFTIRNGLAQGETTGVDYETSGYGGGMYATNAPVVLRKMIFSNNRALGGSTSQTYGGTATGGGLALNATPVGTTCTLQNVSFVGNRALGGTGKDRGGSALGGGMYSDNTVLYGDYLTFTNNIARAGSSNGVGTDTMLGWTSDGLGGGAAIHVSTDSTLSHVVARGNQAIGGNANSGLPDAMAGCGHGGALFAEEAALHLYDSDLRENLAQGGNATKGFIGGGGAIMTVNSTVSIDRTTIISNEARGGNGTTGHTGAASGGGVHLARFNNANTTVSIANTIIANNLVVEGEGATASGGGGGGLWLQGVQANITHTTIARNQLGPTLGFGIGALFVNFGCDKPTVANISYTIIEGHHNSWGAALHVFPGNTINLYRCLFANNSKDTNADGEPGGTPGTITGLQTCIYADSAKFVAPDTPLYDYHLLDISPAKDMATGSSEPVDLDGESRPVDSVADIGADEVAVQLLLLAVTRPASSSLWLHWQASASVLSSLDHFEVRVQCAPDASPPDGWTCGQQQSVGQATDLMLTGLTDGKTYTLTVFAYDYERQLIKASDPVDAIPANVTQIFVPLVLGQ